MMTGLRAFATLGVVLGLFAPLGAAVAAAGGSTTIPDDARLQITYDGRASGIAKVKDRSRNSSVTLGGLRLNFDGMREVPVEAGYHVVVTYEGTNVSGVETQTSSAPFLNGTFTFRGTRQGDACLLTWSDGAQLTARCTTEEFGYEQATSDAQGQSSNIRFAAARTGTVDLAAQERQAQEAQRAEQERIAAAEAAWRALPDAGADLTRQLEGFVETDSQGWAFNRFDVGSIRDVKILNGSAKTGTLLMKGFYTYNGGMTGWVMVQMVQGKFGCIQFWDAIIGCRPLRTAAQGAAMRSAALSLLFGDGVGTGDGKHCDPNDGEGCTQEQINKINEDRAFHYFQQQRGD